MVVGARKSFQFFRQITWFLGNNSALSNFKNLILHYLISIIKLKNNWSVKPNFNLNQREKNCKLFHELLIFLLSFHMDVYFKGL